MSATLGEMIDETLGLLQGQQVAEQINTLSADIGPADLTFNVPNPRGIVIGISAGLIEIDQELIYVTDIAPDGTCTIAPWGRGFRSTVAASHSAGSRITSQPTFPRAKLTDSINQTLERIYPDVFAVKHVQTTAQSFQLTYDLPADAQTVLSVKWQMPDGRHFWKDVRNFRAVSTTGGINYDPAARSVDVFDYMMPGAPVVITYAAQPAPLVNETDDFAAVTGLSLSLKDVVTLGAAVSSLPAQELSRLQMSSVEQQNRAQLVAPSAALTSTRYLEQRFQQRLAEERATLQRLYPARIVWQRR